MATQKERFLSYLQTCVKSTRSTDSNPLFLGGNAPKDYARFLEPDRLFDYNPTKWNHIGSMYDINDYSKALEIFNELIADNDFLQRDNVNNQGWRRGAISHYVCFLSAQEFFLEGSTAVDKSASFATVGPLQRIFYGAPGTGKSHTIQQETIGKSVIRTTFHPDSDYSTFVGAYKPVMKAVRKSVVIGQEEREVTPMAGTNVNREEIGYEFVEQAFLKAYLAAWKKYSEVRRVSASAPITGPVEIMTSSGKFTITAVDSKQVEYSKDSDNTADRIKGDMAAGWRFVWKDGQYAIPTGGRPGGHSLGITICDWIVKNYDNCNSEDFEKGWSYFLEYLKDNTITHKALKQTYVISCPDKDTIHVHTENNKTTRGALMEVFEALDQNESGENVQASVARKLAEFSDDFDMAWEILEHAVKGTSTSGNIVCEPQYLVIEEINRGNCAQIFGDIFQLLDRQDNGFSSYPIEPDTDIQTAIKKAFAEEKEYALAADLCCEGAVEDYTSNYGKTLSEDIQQGNVMLLPPNLYIWATMNTSDQSLFPIDSAFKRRWDWKYVPINTEKESGWVIDLGADGKFSWSSFLKLINERIFETTSSEDKQLGFYFCKAEEKNISAETFVGKVLFFIYNDVFKDYDYSPEFFKAGGAKTMSFHEYFNMDGSINTANVAKLLKALAVESVVEISNDDEDDDYVDSGSGTSSRDQSTYSINGNGSYKKAPLVGAVLTEYVNSNKTLTLDEIKNEWNTVSSEIGSICPANFIETETEFEDRVSKSSDANVRKRAHKIEWDGNVLYVTRQWNIDSITKFVEVVNAKPWGIKIEKL